MNATIETPELSRQLRAERRAAGLTQRELAVLAGVSVTTIANWEAGALPLRRRSPALADARRVLADLQHANGAPDQGAAADDRASEEPRRDSS